MSDWLNLEGVCFSYRGRPVLTDLCASLPGHSRVLALIGTSGVGKSTLIGLLAGHLKPDRGTITVCGQVVSRAGPERPVVFQDHNLFPWMTALENVVFGLRCRGVNAPDRRRAGQDWLERVGLEGHGDAYPSTLSGGMRQRVALARAMALDPACLLLDEPFKELDAATRESLYATFRRLVAERSVRAVIATHQLEEAASLADHTLTLRGPGDCALSRNGN